MDALIKLREIAVHMGLEPAEETSPVGQTPAPDKRRQTTDDGPRPEARARQLAPCGQVLEPGGGQPSSVVGGQASARPSSAVRRPSSALGITHAQLPGGGTIPLLKTLLTSACERNCAYCPFRAGRNYRRATFSPDEMAKTFMDLRRAGVAEGLFLSSGIIGGGVRAQDKLLDTVAILRHKHHFGGYVHLKIMPGAERDQVYRAMQLTDRVSVNLEGANPARLALLAPKKQFVAELLTPLRWIEEIRRERPAHEGWGGRWPSSTTQFVVGAVGESDLELLHATHTLTRQAGLRRAYFSAFSPIADTPLENQPAENPWRQHRLYQASYLFRDYGFDLEEMPFDDAGRLPLDTDPKRAWAEAHLRDAPVEVNRAEREELLRVPGIGPKGAAAILAARRRARLRSVDDLRQVGVRTKDIEPFVLLDGRRPAYQLRLFT